DEPRAAIREVEPVLLDDAPDPVGAQLDVRRVTVPARDLDDVDPPVQRSDLRAQVGQRRDGRRWAAQRVDWQADEARDAIRPRALDGRADGWLGELHADVRA